MTQPPPRSTLFPYTTLFRSTRSDVTTTAVRSRISWPGVSMAIRPLVPLPRRLGGRWPARAPAMRRAIQSAVAIRSEEHTSELQSRENLVCRLLLEKKNNKSTTHDEDADGRRRQT